ncbi:MAG: manganese efflux pump family protein [Thermoanaerobaculia bacterium]|jgi:putative Mn2+ efflux pump MntP|nr:manganese efflux pump family protein [Thermoanaerobaculia bacterium]
MLRIILLGVLAGLDNLQVAAAISMTPLSRGRRALFAVAFCACEVSTPLIGLLLMTALRIRFGAWLDRASPLILVACGSVIIYLALKDNDQLEKLVNNKWTVVGLPLSLSLDNLLIGVSLGTLAFPLPLAALTIGSVSACMCLFGIAGGTRIRRWIPAHAELISGLYLIVIAAMMWIDPRT